MTHYRLEGFGNQVVVEPRGRAGGHVGNHRRIGNFLPWLDDRLGRWIETRTMLCCLLIGVFESLLYHRMVDPRLLACSSFLSVKRGAVDDRVGCLAVTFSVSRIWLPICVRRY